MDRISTQSHLTIIYKQNISYNTVGKCPQDMLLLILILIYVSLNHISDL